MAVIINDLGRYENGQNGKLDKADGHQAAYLKQGIIHHAGLQVSVVSLGASVQDVRFTEQNVPLVLGFNDPWQYQHNPCFLGSTVGRCANRIAYGTTCLQDQLLQLTRHADQTHHLHGGPKGSATRNWHMQATDNGLVLTDTLPHGHMGYPGNLQVQMEITVGKADALQVITSTTDTGLAAYIDVKITASTDATTLCNFTPHWYFNLGTGNSKEQLGQHYLQVYADSYLPTDDSGIPQSLPVNLDNSPMDMRRAVSLTDALLARLDHNYCVVKDDKAKGLKGLQPVAKLWSTTSNTTMKLLTNQVGLQVYGGKLINIPASDTLTGEAYLAFSGIALEPQGWPDALNNKYFPSVQLNPTDTYSHHSRYEFKAQT